MTDEPIDLNSRRNPVRFFTREKFLVDAKDFSERTDEYFAALEAAGWIVTGNFQDVNSGSVELVCMREVKLGAQNE